MASVRMTNDLRNKIVVKAKDIFKAAVAKAENSLDATFYNHLFNEIYEIEFKPYNISNWPIDWTRKPEGLSGKIRGTIDNESISYVINGAITTELKIPKISDLVDYNNFYRASNYSPSSSLFTEFDKYKKRCNKIITERDTFAREIKAIVARCNTVKQFLDAWPQGESLLDASTIHKLHEVPAKRTVADRMSPEASVNLSSVLIKRTIMDQT